MKITRSAKLFGLASLVLIGANVLAASAQADVVERLAKTSSTSAKEAKAQLNQVFEAIQSELIAGEEVSVRGFGKFYLSQSKAREGRNPKNGAKIQIPAKRYAKFRPSAKLKEKLNDK